MRAHLAIVLLAIWSLGASIPALSSRPGAPVTLYLDFTGAPSFTWYSTTVPATPAFDLDNDPSTFNGAEVAVATDTFNRVVDFYSPFDINVTTVDPGALTQYHVERVIIGGDPAAWTNSSVGGVGSVNGFFDSNSSGRTAFVFPMNVGNGAIGISRSIAHEIGHTFGLDHHSLYDINGNKTATYDPGNASVAPIMGTSYGATRALWYDSAGETSASIFQDDLAILSTTPNGPRYRTDDVGSTTSTSGALAAYSGGLTADGVIEQTTDSDWFGFSVPTTSSVTLDLEPRLSMGMFRAKIQLRDALGNLITEQDSTSTLGASFTASLSPGTYFAVADSHGGYGDVGEYTLTVAGNVLPAGPVPEPEIVAMGVAIFLLLRARCHPRAGQASSTPCPLSNR